MYLKHCVIYYILLLLLLLLLGLFLWVPLLAYFGKIEDIKDEFVHSPITTTTGGTLALALGGLLVAWIISRLVRH